MTWYTANADLPAFLSGSVRLFNYTLSAILSLPVLRFFLAVLLFLIVVSLFAMLTRQGRRGRL